MKEILTNALIDLLLAALTIAGGALVAYLTAKKNEIEASSKEQYEKNIDMQVLNAISNSVRAVNQTFVEALKKADKFDKEAQLEAFEMALEGTISALSRETIDFINNTYGDINLWLKNKIESEVHSQKNKR